jgi:transcriptional regulator GlxA family with amidase domain
MSATFAIFVYPGTEPIDLATFGVLSMARRIDPGISVHTVSEQTGAVTLASGLVVMADYGLETWPGADLLIVTGGPGWKQQCETRPVLEFLRRAAEHSTVASVCTGAMILAAAGLLVGTKATTKRRVVAPEESPLALLGAHYPDIEVVEAPVVDAGKTVTSGGVSYCIDATLYLVRRFCGDHVADETARIIEFDPALRARHFKAESA